MSEVTKEDVKNAALKIAKETGSNDVTYTGLQQELNKIALGKLDELVKELLEAEPDFGEVDDKGTAKKSDDELILKLKGAKKEAPKEAAPKKEKPKESAVDKEKKKTEKKAKKEVATKKAGAKKDAKAKGKEAQKGLLAKIKGWFGR